ncbi:CPCC family cysteine-rich protein [Streptomyces anulatus]|uniref:CPCC family cysteine-rich protein n=1 Tax=Streptomyces anulatus TaxID=1892 RepID=UPI00340C2253
MMSAMVSEELLSSLSTNAGDSLIACPCCYQKALEKRANFEICPECRWEDDGQDADAHLVRGGPNGRLSLRQARLEYLEDAAEGCEPVVGARDRLPGSAGASGQWQYRPLGPCGAAERDAGAVGSP